MQGSADCAGHLKPVIAFPVLISLSPRETGWRIRQWPSQMMGTPSSRQVTRPSHSAATASGYTLCSCDSQRNQLSVWAVVLLM